MPHVLLKAKQTLTYEQRLDLSDSQYQRLKEMYETVESTGSSKAEQTLCMEVDGLIDRAEVLDSELPYDIEIDFEPKEK